MDEFRNKPTLHGLARGNFDANRLALYAVQNFAECPKFVTIARHTNLSETTPLECRLAHHQGSKPIMLKVPKQPLRFFRTSEGFRFTTTRVVKEGTQYWLIACDDVRKAFLVPQGVLDSKGSLSRAKRLRPGRIYN